MPELTRRQFLIGGATASGALLLGLVPVARSENQNQAERQLGFFVTVEADGKVIIGSNQPEIGQGLRTALVMLIAEELEVPWQAVSYRQMPLGIVKTADGYTWKYGGQGVGGSTGLTANYERMRQVGASARHMLEQAAAQRWEVDAADCRGRQGEVHHLPTGRTLSYAELAAAAAALPVPEAAPALKPQSEFSIVGQNHSSIDALEVVTGKARFGIDTRVPGMRYAVVARSPKFDATVRSFDASAAMQVPGVQKVVAIQGPAQGEPYLVQAHGVAVVADSTWAAIKGREALSVQWNESPWSDESTAGFDRQANELLGGKGQVVRNDGDLDSAMQQAARMVEARYVVPFVSHAPLEPQNCFAHVTDNAATIIVPTQSPSGVSRSVHAVTGIDRESIEVRMTKVGGGFGRRLSTDYAAEAAMISQKTGLPIQLLWTREDDLKHDFFRPAGHHELRAGVDDSGLPIAWTQRLASASKYYRRPNMPDDKLWEAELYPDDFPGGMIDHLRLEYFPVSSGIPRGSWRAPAHTANAFVIQSFIDEVAHQTGQDPLALRLRMLGEARELPYANHGGPTFNPGRLAKLLKFIAEKSDYAATRPEGRGLGIACHFTFGGYAAHAIEVSVADDGQLTIERVVGAIDCGYAVHPNAVMAQMEGGTIDGLSTALNLAITVDGGQVVQSNFHNYPLARMAVVPRAFETHIVPWDEKPTGVGEIPIPPVAPALTNAIFNACGKRIRRLPIADQLTA